MSPSGKNKYGYLLYDEITLERAKKIKYLNEVGFTLKEVNSLIDSSNIELRQALIQRKFQLENDMKHTESLIKSMDEMIKKLGEGV